MKLAGLFLSFAFANTSELFTSTKQVGEHMDTIAKMADEGERPERPCLREFYEGCFYSLENRTYLWGIQQLRGPNFT